MAAVIFGLSVEAAPGMAAGRCDASSFWDVWLLSDDAQAGRSVVPGFGLGHRAARLEGGSVRE